VIIYYPNPPPGVSPKFHIFWKTFTVIEMVGRVNVKASQHNKKPIVVHIDRVLDFDASRSEKEQTMTAMKTRSSCRGHHKRSIGAALN
jgi:hypothetical protein